MSAQTHIKPNTVEHFSQLLRDHHRELLVYTRTLTGEEHHAKDITQDAFVTAWEHISVFDVTRDFAAWMRGIIRNKWREWLRKMKKTTSIDDEALEIFEAEIRVWEASSLHGGSTLFHQLEACIEKLPEALAQAIQTYYGDGYKSDEAAMQLSINSATLRKRLERARTNLKQCINVTPGE